MTSPSIRLVCFDLGGVLIRICRSWSEGVTKAGLPLHLNGAKLDGHSVPGWHDLIVQHQTGVLNASRYANQLSRAMNGVYSPQEVLAVHQAWMYGEYEGVGAVIDRIHAAGLPTACLSNTNHAHWEQLLEFPAIKKLTHRFASHEMRLYKPDAAIFREVERRVGFAGGEILYFDDLAENVAIAKACGWHAIDVDPSIRTDQQIDAAIRRFSVTC